MAKKGTKRQRRTPEQKIEDLQAEIERIKNRQAARELKQSEGYKLTLTAVRTIDKAIESAKEEGHSALGHVLHDAREPLANHLSDQGVALPQARRPRGRRPKNV